MFPACSKTDIAAPADSLVESVHRPHACVAQCMYEQSMLAGEDGGSHVGGISVQPRLGLGWGFERHRVGVTQGREKAEQAVGLLQKIELDVGPLALRQSCMRCKQASTVWWCKTILCMGTRRLVSASQLPGR